MNRESECRNREIGNRSSEWSKTNVIARFVESTEAAIMDNSNNSNPLDGGSPTWRRKFRLETTHSWRRTRSRSVFAKVAIETRPVQIRSCSAGELGRSRTCQKELGNRYLRNTLPRRPWIRAGTSADRESSRPERGAACRAAARSLAKTAAARKGPATDNVANATFNVSQIWKWRFMGERRLLNLTLNERAHFSRIMTSRSTDF